MRNTTTPGQICYEAYFTALAGGICHCLSMTWGATSLAEKVAWEAAAQAVRGSALLIARDVFEHLLHCLANQKYLHEMLPAMRAETQQIIDDAWQRGMDLLHREDTP